jgi:hypothetical protein
MAGRAVEYVVEDARAPRRAVRPDLFWIAQDLRNDAAAATPYRTGTLAGGWEVVPTGKFNWRVINDVPYVRFVEFGVPSRGIRPRAMLGRALARAQAAHGG